MADDDATKLPAIVRGLRGAVLGVSSENSIGYQCALRLHAMGADVAITTRTSKRATGAELAARLGASQHQVADADDDESVRAAFASFGEIDFVVHAWMHVATDVLAKPLMAVSADEFMRVLDVGAYSLVRVARHAAPALARSASPRIVTFTSPAAHRSTSNYHVAGIAKSTLESTLRYLAHELGPQGILCNAVSSSLIATDGALRLGGEPLATSTRAHVARKAPTRRASDLDDVAMCAAYLCSPIARNVTGEIVSVDGGFANRYL